jgi:hypothetical protein
MKTMCRMALVQDWAAVTQELISRCTIKCVWVKGTNDPRLMDRRSRLTNLAVSDNI